MFVGVGASRVRDLFKKAKDNAPCIVFIDEIDAVGRQRGAGIGGATTSESRLNQLLTEMMGLRATRALSSLRQLTVPMSSTRLYCARAVLIAKIGVDAPDIKGRLEILNVHARNKKLAPEVALDVIAVVLPGFTGADLANLLNEAAIPDARWRKDAITMLEIDDAVDRAVAGMNDLC